MAKDPALNADLGTVLRSLCDGAAAAIGVTGASVTLVGSSGVAELVFASDQVAAELADLEFTVGAGPGVAAMQSNRPVLVPDVAAGTSSEEREMRGRWEVHGEEAAAFVPVLREHAREAGIGAVFAFPLQVGAVRLGVLHLYRAERGDMDESAFRRSVRLAEQVTHALLGLGDDGDGVLPPEASGLSRAAVHQATGMVMVQLGVSLEEAFARLRAHAFAEGVPLKEVADQIVARRLRLDQTGDER